MNHYVEAGLMSTESRNLAESTFHPGKGRTFPWVIAVIALLGLFMMAAENAGYESNAVLQAKVDTMLASGCIYEE